MRHVNLDRLIFLSWTSEGKKHAVEVLLAAAVESCLQAIGGQRNGTQALQRMKLALPGPYFSSLGIWLINSFSPLPFAYDQIS